MGGTSISSPVRNRQQSVFQRHFHTGYCRCLTTIIIVEQTCIDVTRITTPYIVAMALFSPTLCTRVAAQVMRTRATVAYCSSSSCPC